MCTERIVQRARDLAAEKWNERGRDLTRIPPAERMPPRSEFAGLELELGRALSSAEELLLTHAYRGALHTLNALHELAELERRHEARS